MSVQIVPGTAVKDLFDRVRLRLNQYSEVVLCSPYLDEATITFARDILVAAGLVRCGMRVVTRAEPARRLLACLPGSPFAWRRSIQVRTRLHAKVYWAAGRTATQSEAIVTSANFTIDGMTFNDELGVRVTGETLAGRNALALIRSSIRKWIH